MQLPGFGPTHVTAFNFNGRLRGLVFKYSYIEGRGLGLQPMNLGWGWGHTQLITEVYPRLSLPSPNPCFWLVFPNVI